MLAVIIYDLVSYQTNDYEHFNLPGLRQWTPATLVQYPTGRGSHRTLTPLFSTATAGLTSSKMDNIIALTTPGGAWTPLQVQGSQGRQVLGGLDAPLANLSRLQRTEDGPGQIWLRR